MEESEKSQLSQLLLEQKQVYLDMRGILNKQVEALKNGESEILLSLMEQVNDFRLRAAKLQEKICWGRYGEY